MTSHSTPLQPKRPRPAYSHFQGRTRFHLPLQGRGLSLSLYNSRSLVPKVTYAKVTRTTFLQGHFVSPSRSPPRSRACCRHFTIRGYSCPRSDPFKVTPAQGHSRPRSLRPRSEDGDLGRRARTGQSLLLTYKRISSSEIEPTNNNSEIQLTISEIEWTFSEIHLTDSEIEFTISEIELTNSEIEITFSEI